jgi:ABC-type transport system involved in multi-copper enzyme maturation permease subunit
MNQLFVIGSHQLYEEFCRKSLYLFFVLPLVCIYASTLFTSFTPGSEQALMIDVSLSSISFFMMIITAIIVSDFFVKEEYQGTLYFYTTNPVRSSALVFGKTFGILVFVFLEILIIVFFTCVLFYVNFGRFNPGFIKAAILLMGEMMILLGYGVLGAAMFSKFINLVFVMMIYTTGHLASDFEHLKIHSGEYGSFLYWFSYVIPNLNRFEARDAVVLGFNLKWSGIINAFLYAISLSFFLNLMSTFILKRRYDS